MTETHLDAHSPIDAARSKHYTTCMEQLQEAYVMGVASAAGCTVEYKRRDVFGVDVQIIRPPADATIQEISVYAQLKSTLAQKPDPDKDYFSYQFKKRQYMEHLVKRRSSPKAILIVMAMPPIQASWTIADHENLKISHCCYWVSLEGASIAPGVQSPSVRIPTVNKFDAQALNNIMDTLDRGGELG
ncbi:DUF4365 domain-containing protein [Nonomuraea pusilla]|uniref:DUF4365 domain-containing protein n=1 Tax=Nonomuraea pusilla TaxID=46177 RepID=UPI0033321C4A